MRSRFLCRALGTLRFRAVFATLPISTFWTRPYHLNQVDKIWGLSRCNDNLSLMFEFISVQSHCASGLSFYVACISSYSRLFLSTPNTRFHNAKIDGSICDVIFLSNSTSDKSPLRNQVAICTSYLSLLAENSWKKHFD